MKPLFKNFALITTFLAAGTLHAQDEIYFQPFEKICYETYFGTGCQPSPTCYAPPAPKYCVTPEVTKDCCGEIFFRADFLYWKTNENGLNHCVPTKVFDRIDCDGFVRSIRKEKNNDPSFDWAPGFRIATGYRFLDTCWELSAYWTNLYTKASSDLTNHGKLHCGLNFNAVDLLASYKFCAAPCFTLKPYFGLRIATVDQTLKSSFDDGHEKHKSSQFHGHNKERFVGVGPLIGLEGVLNLKYGLGIYASAAVAGLYGDYHLQFKNRSRFHDSESIYNLKQHLHSWEAALDFALGIRWEHCLGNTFACCSQNMRIIFDLGLEHHHYFRLNRFNSNHQAGSKRHGSDLYFDGVNLAAKLAF